jgi:hypothetical protein
VHFSPRIGEEDSLLSSARPGKKVDGVVEQRSAREARDEAPERLRPEALGGGASRHGDGGDGVAGTSAGRVDRRKLRVESVGDGGEVGQYLIGEAVKGPEPSCAR